MPKSVTVRVDGLQELGRNLRELGADMAGKVARAMTNAGAQVIRRQAVKNAPKATGNLKKNIIVKRIPKGETALTSEHIVTVRSGKLTEKQRGSGLADAFYARFVEHGTVKMAARPFMRPAFDQKKEAAKDAMIQRARDRIAKVGKR